MKQTIFCVVLAFMAFAGNAMTLKTQGNLVFATGPVEDDYAKFREALEQPGVDTVVFVNSPGGDLWAGMNVGRLIADKGINTVIAGHCLSACSIMFMGGKERSFSDAFRPSLTQIGIHGPASKDVRALMPQQGVQIRVFYQQRMGEKYNAQVIEKALYDMDDAGALLRVFDMGRLPKRVAYHCKSATSPRKACTEFQEHDAFSLGIVTTTALTQVALPDGFRNMPNVWGRELIHLIPDMDAYVKTLDAQQCTSDRCRQLITGFLAGKENKALAVPVDGAGLGISGNQDTEALASAKAIYGCNHVRNVPPRLCEVRVVNGYDVREVYSTGAQDHAEALKKLTVPSEKYYANEEFGGGMTTASGLRTKNWRDITPQKVDGIRTLSTQELAAALKSANPPVVIDVLSGVVVAIPSALTLMHGGLAFDDPAVDSSYEARFAGLLKLLSPDLSKPIVFYCAGRDLWLSANAALRAKKLGYTDVGWYRGGIASWTAANLPVAPVVIRAAVQ